MQAIDRWVIRNVFQAICDPDVIPTEVTLTVNLSGQSLGDRRFLEYIERESKQGRIPLERICFEITETAAITNLSYAMSFFSALKPQGAKFALDDFGCGLSSFAYLKTLPVDYLKIDGGFVKDMTSDSINFAMVEAIHRIGHVMGIETIAECVEHKHTLLPLREIGVDYAQGNALACPMPLADVPGGCQYIKQADVDR
jgi:EAL domain-containing protein (putative c-di-GMP-specific phosphodiesterase class I)